MNWTLTFHPIDQSVKIFKLQTEFYSISLTLLFNSIYRFAKIAELHIFVTMNKVAKRIYRVASVSQCQDINSMKRRDDKMLIYNTVNVNLERTARFSFNFLWLIIKQKGSNKLLFMIHFWCEKGNATEVLIKYRYILNFFGNSGCRSFTIFKKYQS